ncbi:MAG: pentapeptide repeat-containing protein [Candidatus Thiodiazotropha sp.]
MFHNVTYWEKDVPVMPTRFVDSTFLFAHFENEVLDSVVFKGCALRGANFKNCNLSHARFLDCDLSGADFEHASMDGVNLYGSTLTAGQLSEAEAADWSTVGVGKTGLTIDQLHGGL